MTAIQIDRARFAKALALATPALSNKPYIPALVHFLVAGGKVTAYDDILAVQVAVAGTEGLSCCLLGELLTKAVGSYGAAEILVQPHATEAAVVLSSGRSKIKVPTLPAEDFPLTWPTTRGAVAIPLTAQILKGIEYCLPGAGVNPNHPAQMGVTLDEKEGAAVLFSTDNTTISRYLTTEKSLLPASSPVIFPTAFCDRVLALAKAFPQETVTLYLSPGALVVEVGTSARVLSRQLADLVPLDFVAVTDKYTKGLSGKALNTLPDGWEASLGRAALVTGGDHSVVTVSEHRKALRILASSSFGEVDETLAFGGTLPPSPVKLDPALLTRGSKVCTKMSFAAQALVLVSEDGNYLHLVAYTA
jgi:hypothetical protein